MGNRPGNAASRKGKQSREKKGLWPLFVSATVVLAVFVHLYIVLFVPPSRDKVWKEIEVTEGMSFKTIAALFEKEGVIRNHLYFRVLGRMRGISRKVRTGYYGFSTNMSMWNVLNTLRRGRIIEYEIVIPEGYNLYQIGWTLANTPIISNPQQFISLVQNKEYVRSVGIEADSLEGYLYPDTYYLPKGIKLEEIPRTMVQRFRSVFNNDYRARARELGFTEHEIVTLASIIEKESSIPAERKLISAVYLNRLKLGMRLQADPTVVYGKKAWITNVTRKDLKRRSPYNTYLHKGLPPGPIANPGEGSLLAALYPDDVDYLFFVAQGDGSHYFSKDFRSHTQAVNRYFERKRKAREQKKQARAEALLESQATETPGE